MDGDVLLVILHTSRAQSLLAYLRLQPRRHITYGMRHGEFRLRLGTIEGMRFGQLTLQILLVELLCITMLVHVQIEGLLQREELLIGQIWFGEIIFIDGLLEFCKMLHEILMSNLECNQRSLNLRKTL